MYVITWRIINCLFTLFSGLVLPYLKAKDFVDENGNLGFIINMKKLQPVLMDDTEISRNESQQPANKRIRLENNQWLNFESLSNIPTYHSKNYLKIKKKKLKSAVKMNL